MYYSNYYFNLIAIKTSKSRKKSSLRVRILYSISGNHKMRGVGFLSNLKASILIENNLYRVW